MVAVVMPWARRSRTIVPISSRSISSKNSGFSQDSSCFRETA
jgi:hypothetical protein